MNNPFNNTKLKEKVKELEEEISYLKKLTTDENEWKKCFLHETLFNKLKTCVAIYKVIDNGNDFVFLDVNEAGLTLDKITKEDVIGKKVTEAYPGIKDFGLYEIFQRVLETGNAEEHPLTLYHDNRISGWREYFVFKIPDQDIIIAIYEDATEKALLKDTILKNEARFKLLFENSPVGFLSLDKNGCITEVNTTLLSTLNYQKEELKGNPFIEFLSPDSAKQFDNILPTFRENGEARDIELKMKRKDGAEIYVSLTGKTAYMRDSSYKEMYCVIEDITERKKIINEISLMSRFPEENPYPVLKVRHDGILLYANPGSKILLKHWKIQKDDKLDTYYLEKIKLTINSGKDTLIEVICGQTIYSLVIVPVRDTDYVNIYGKDITSLKKTEENLRKINRMYAFISQVDQTIVRVNNRDELFEQICINALGYGKFKLSWIGRVDYEKQEIIPIKHSCVLQGYLDNVRISIKDEPEGRGPGGKCIRERKTIVCNNLTEDHDMLPWREKLLKYNYKSSACIPLYLEDRIEAVLTVYTDEKDFFNTEEIKLLEEIGNDISHTLKRIKIEEENKIINDKLKESEVKYKSLITELPLAIINCDLYGNITFVNNTMLQMLGSPSEEATKAVNLFYFQPLQAIGFPDMIKECINTGNKVIADREYTSKWGKKSVYHCQFLPLKDSNKEITGVFIMAIDLTERKKAEDELKYSEKLFRVITETAPYPISIFNKSDEYIYMNPAFTKLFGYNIEEMPTREKWFELMYPDPEYREMVKSSWKNKINAKDDNQRNYIVTSKDGTTHSIVFNFLPIDYNRNLMFYFEINKL